MSISSLDQAIVETTTMCLLPVWICPNCDRKTRVRVRPPKYCNNPLCVKLKDKSRCPADEPCHPSCCSERCGLVYQFRYCFDSCQKVDDDQKDAKATTRPLPQLSDFWIRDPAAKSCV